MPKVLANGQITIVDLNDGKAVQCFTQCSKGETQIYTPDTGVYTPNYSASEPNVITARVYVTGNTDDQAPSKACTGWSWKVDGVAATPVSGKSYQLNLASNIAKNGSVKNIEWSCTYTDPETKATTTCIGYKTISLAKSGGALQTVQIETPDGNTFDSTNNTKKLRAVAKFFRGNVQDTSLKSMTWDVLNISAGTWSPVSSGSASLLNGVSTLNVSANDVLNFQTFRCTVVDGTDTAYAIVTFFDASDPYMIEVYSLTGDKIVNGAQSTELFARVWKDGKVVEDGALIKAESSTPSFTYKWTKYNANGVATNWNGTSSAENETKKPYVTVAAADVSGRGTFTCEVSK
jgi:hypothetical protein